MEITKNIQFDPDAEEIADLMLHRYVTSDQQHVRDALEKAWKGKDSCYRSITVIARGDVACVAAWSSHSATTKSGWSLFCMLGPAEEITRFH